VQPIPRPTRPRGAPPPLPHRPRADPLDDEGPGPLAAPEPGELQLAPELPCLALEPALELLRRDLHLHAHARIRELGDGGLDGGRHPRHDTVPRMTAWRQQPARKRLETSLWTGPLGHLLGGGL